MLMLQYLSVRILLDWLHFLAHMTADATDTCRISSAEAYLADGLVTYAEKLSFPTLKRVSFQNVNSYHTGDYHLRIRALCRSTINEMGGHSLRSSFD